MVKRTSIFILFFSGLYLLIFSSAYQVSTQGNLMIMPKRVVFDGSKKSHELNLANTGHDTARYMISVVHYKMNDDGSFTQASPDYSDSNYADKFIRFFPRSVMLGPGESQTVRVQLTNSNKLLPGEYRSHLYFRAMANEKPLGEEDIKSEDPTSISVRITPIFGISIPVVIRVGESDAQIALSKGSFELYEDSIPLVNVTLNRTGNMSVYGDFTIEHVSSRNKITKVGSVQGLALYTPNQFRNIKIALDKKATVNYKEGKLHIVYRTRANGNTNNIAQMEVYLN